MVAYEYYLRDEIKGFELIGILPERRKDLSRITQKSIVGFGKHFWGDHVKVDTNNILFLRIRIDEKTGKISRPKPPLGFDFED
jgi:hypothetical protein